MADKDDSEPAIEVAPGEIEWEGPPESETQRERSEYAASQRYPRVPAVPAQEAPRGCNLAEIPGHDCAVDACEPAEPQAGAQVPSQLKTPPTIMQVRALEITIGQMQAHLNSIKSYATEAAKTPITRESILAAPQVPRYRISPDGELEKHPAGLIVTYPDYLDTVKAKTLTQLTQCDELQGLCRLVLSEIGGGK